MITPDRLMGVAFILLSTIFEAVGQIAFKRAAHHEPGAPLGAFHAAWFNLNFIFVGWLGFVLDGLLWSAALYYLDVTVAHPIGSIVFVVVAIFSKLFLREKLSRRRWIGIGFILGGAVVVAMN